jgi:hypothetical protein
MTKTGYIGMQCPRGQEYKMCSEPCTRSCQELSRSLECKNNRCLEGCRCPPGQTLDRRDRCIPIAECSCTHNGFEYLAGHKELRKGPMGNQIWYVYFSFFFSNIGTLMFLIIKIKASVV